jgi:hypothetical protein
MDFNFCVCHNMIFDFFLIFLIQKIQEIVENNQTNPKEYIFDVFVSFFVF